MFFLALDLKLQAPVLGHAPFGDVKIRHDLDARGNSAVEFLGRRRLLVKNAVYAIADAYFLRKRLDMNVGRVGFDGPGED